MSTILSGLGPRLCGAIPGTEARRHPLYDTGVNLVVVKPHEITQTGSI